MAAVSRRRNLSAARPSFHPTRCCARWCRIRSLPTVASILGPAEAAYFAQSEVLYSRILGRMPVAVPRAGFTILDSRSQKRMDRYGLTLARFLPRPGGAAGARGRRADSARSVDPPARHRWWTWIPPWNGCARVCSHSIRRSRKRSRTSARKIRHQAGKIQAKTGREAHAPRRARRPRRRVALRPDLSGAAFQERLYSILPLRRQARLRI